MLKKTVLALAGITTLAMAQIPYLGSASDALWSRSTELSIGKAAYDRLYQNGQIYESAADVDYLNYLGNKIASSAQTRLGLRFYLTRSQSINAFASPGGYIGVNVGLVLATENEHELAAVLAHEIGHVSQEHIARSVLAAKDRRLANAAALVAGILLARADSQLGAATLSAALAGETQSRINDIRRHEIEADNIGRRLMTQAGFSVLGMQTFFGKLYTPSTLNNAPAYLLTHPLPKRRQAALDTLKKRAKHLTSRDEYYLFRARIQAEFLSNAELTALIQQAKRSSVSAQRDSAHYLDALFHLKQGKLQKALSALSPISRKLRQNRDILLLKAKLLLLNNQTQSAIAVYEKLWQRYTGDSVVAYDYGQLLSQQKQYTKAKSVIKKAINNASDSQLFWLYGRILGLVGDIAQQQKILIQYYRQNGEYALALAQAQIAANHTGLDWQSRAGFEAARKELERIIEATKE